MITIIRQWTLKNIYQNRILYMKYFSTNPTESGFQKHAKPNENNLAKLMNKLEGFPTAKTGFITIQSLANEGNITYEMLKDNKQYNVLQLLLANSSRSESILNSLNTLNHLDILEFPRDSDAVKGLEMSILQKEDTNIAELLHLYRVFLKRQETPTEEMILKTIKQRIEENISFIRYTSEIVFLHRNYTDFSESVLCSLDEIAIKICDTANFTDLKSLITSLAEIKRRNPLLLYTISYYLCKSAEVMVPKQIIAVFGALCDHNYFDIDLLNKLTSAFIFQINNIDRPSIIGSMVIYIGQCRFRHVKLLEALSIWIEKNAENCKANDLARYLITLATVNYIPSNFDNIMKKVSPIIKDDSALNPVMRVNSVWALVVLNKADKQIITSVLKQSVYDSLPKVVQALTSINLKLLNINSAAKLMIDYDKQTLSDDIVKEIMMKANECNLIQSKTCIKILENILISRKVSDNILTHFGIIIGAEFVIDSKGSPLLLEKYTTEYGTKESTSPLPTGGHRIAAMFWYYKRYCHNSHDLTGESVLAKYLLEKHGYNVLEMPHYEFESSVVDNVKKVNNMITQICNKQK